MSYAKETLLNLIPQYRCKNCLIYKRIRSSSFNLKAQTRLHICFQYLSKDEKLCLAKHHRNWFWGLPLSDYAKFFIFFFLSSAAMVIILLWTLSRRGIFWRKDLVLTKPSMQRMSSMPQETTTTGEGRTQFWNIYEKS